MKSRLKVLLKIAYVGMLVLGFATQAYAVSDMSETAWPFSKNTTGVQQFENNTAIGLYNSHVGVLIRKKDATVLGIWTPHDVNLINSKTSQPLWSLELMPEAAEESIKTDAFKTTPHRYHFVKNKNGITLEIDFDPVHAGENRCTVTANVSLNPNERTAHWRMNAKMMDNTASVWNVSYPQLLISAADNKPEGNHLVTPYRRGQLRPYGKSNGHGHGLVESERPHAYPGWMAEFQFIAAYGENSHHGFYLAAQDAKGYRKVFYYKNRPKEDAVVLTVEHKPANRGVPGTGFEQPYDIVTQPFTGDWYNAARIYRKWWTKQIWARRGLLRDRKDMPPWLKHTQVWGRGSSTSLKKTAETNEDAFLSLQKILNSHSFGETWYGVWRSLTGNVGLNKAGTGHIVDVRKDVANVVPKLKKKGIHNLAYLQSTIYDPLDTEPSDNDTALKYVARKRNGEPEWYGKIGYSMDRSTSWWQDRLIKRSEQAIKAGFDGIYLDSFGRSTVECFSSDHGHPIGGGNTGIAGQRQMASRILKAIHEISPDAVLSGEDPVEAFRDLIQINLYSANVWPDPLPLYRVIWGDYSLGHGRWIKPSKEGKDNMIPEMAQLFVNGIVLGRIAIRTDGQTLFDKDEYTNERKMLQEMADYGDHAIEYLRFGEYLHPVQWSKTLPEVTFYESTKNREQTLPAVSQSVTRSYKDGSVGIALVNIDNKEISLQVPITPGLRKGKSAKNIQTTLWRMDRTGKRTKLSQGKEAWNQSVTLRPHEIAFLIIK